MECSTHTLGQGRITTLGTDGDISSRITYVLFRMNIFFIGVINVSCHSGQMQNYFVSGDTFDNQPL